MKTTRIAVCALLLAGTLAGAGSAAAAVAADIHIGPSGRATVDLGFFYDDLASYGHWVERPQYGWVWTPRGVAETWRPYQDGHWVWTDEGWLWVSDEPYGWATYHYGRWYDDPDYGWSWVPGDEYSPAWVSWQEGGDYVGWAPLPPSVSVSFQAGPLTVSLAPDTYVFVPTARFLDPRPYRYAVPRQDCERVYRQTRSFTEYQVVNQRVVNRGVPVDQIQRVVGRPVPRYQVAEMSANQRHQGGGARVAGNRVTIFRPQVQKAQVAPPPQRPAARVAVLKAPPAMAPGKGKTRPGTVVAGPAPAPQPKGRPAPHQPAQQQPPAVARQAPPANTGGRQMHPKHSPKDQPPIQAEAQPPVRERQGRGPRQERSVNPNPNSQPNGPKPSHNPRGGQERRAAEEQRTSPPQPRPQPRPMPREMPREQPQPQREGQGRGPGHGQGQAHGQEHPNQGNQGNQGHRGGGHNKPEENDKKPPV